jgi:hypothetical protein
MVAIDFLDSTVPSKGVVEMHRSSTRYHKNMTDAVVGQSLYNVISNAHLVIKHQLFFL